MNKHLLLTLIFGAFLVGVMIAQPKEALISPEFYPTPTPIELNEQKLEQMINLYREGLDKQPFTHEDRLCTFADTRLPIVQANFSHDGFTDLTDTYYKKYPEMMGIGENLAQYFQTEVQTLGAWLDSPLHRQNIEFNWYSSCVRCQGTFCVHIFARY